ncbi:caspase domain-containing protein [Maritimibacter alkaliphilus]|uniref:caspase family protein n=1 Tax=Maritimibacter alkaliphilus TaxID=404236 RepID=UPI001C94CD7D|nr:caspase family protein [Maritimibacter alkaliphilus]MBY6089237.1 caspase family protein [Maritimibacter alkaliphilus]
MFFRLFFLCLVTLFLAPALPARAEQRIALVVGNSDYEAVSPLANPSNDAALIAATLEGLGFEVHRLIDVDRAELTRGIAHFGRALRGAGPEATGLFYYAGHGVQSFGVNYLLPVSAELSDAADLSLVAVEVQSVLRQMFSAGNRTNIMILDACRNNPFSNIPEFNDNGLAEMKAPTGTFLAYATAPGAVAMDGGGENSPFTRAMASLMPTPGLPIEQMFKQVRVEVLRETGGMQTPWDSSSLVGDFSFAEGEKLTARDLEAQQFWESIKDSRDPVQIMLFLRGYGDTAFAGEARGLLTSVMEQELAGVGVPAAPTASEAPPEDEQKLFEAAQASNSIEGYERYLSAYPEGTFAEFAQGELVALREKAGADGTPGGVSLPEVAPAPPAAAVEPKEEVITFLSPLTSSEPAVNGLSISEIIESTPLFPPVEGLPESFWKGQKCSSCHHWTQERICTQAQTYLEEATRGAVGKEHPFGGAFKQKLQTWAASGCN